MLHADVFEQFGSVQPFCYSHIDRKRKMAPNVNDVLSQFLRKILSARMVVAFEHAQVFVAGNGG